MRFFAFLAEGQIHVSFAERFAEIAVNRRHAALPARLLFLLAGQVFAVEGEVFIDEFSGKHGGFAVDEVIGQVILPVVERHAFQQLGFALEKVRHGDVQAFHGWRVKSREVEIPVESVVERFEVRELHFVVNRHGIAPRSDIQGSFRQGGFDTHDSGGLLGGVRRRNADQLQHAGDMGDVFFAGFDGFGVGAEIIILLRQPDATLVGLADYGVGIFEVLAGGEIEHHVDADAMQAADFGAEVAQVFDGADAVEFRLQRLQAFFVDGGYIHAGSVIVADLLRVRVAIGGDGGFIENLPENRPVSLLEFAETAPGRLVGRYRIVLQPGAAGVLVKVFAGIGLLIDGREIEAGRGFQIAGFLCEEGGGKEYAE